MKISSRERKIFLYSLLFLVISGVLAFFANIWFTFNQSSGAFKAFIAGYSIVFLGFSGLVSIVAGKFFAQLKRSSIVAALTMYIILAVPTNYMFWLLLHVLSKILPKVLLDLTTYTNGKQLIISILGTLIVFIASTIWFFFAKKRRKNQKISNPTRKN